MNEEGTTVLLATCDAQTDTGPPKWTHTVTHMQWCTHIHEHTHTYTRMLKTYRTVGVETLLVIAGCTILPEPCVSHYRLGYPAITSNPTQISKLTQPISLLCTFIVDLGNPPGEQPPAVGSVFHTSSVL